MKWFVLKPMPGAVSFLKPTRLAAPLHLSACRACAPIRARVRTTSSDTGKVFGSVRLARAPCASAVARAWYGAGGLQEQYRLLVLRLKGCVLMWGVRPWPPLLSSVGAVDGNGEVLSTNAGQEAREGQQNAWVGLAFLWCIMTLSLTFSVLPPAFLHNNHALWLIQAMQQEGAVLCPWSTPCPNRASKKGQETRFSDGLRAASMHAGDSVSHYPHRRLHEQLWPGAAAPRRPPCRVGQQLAFAGRVRVWRRRLCAPHW